MRNDHAIRGVGFLAAILVVMMSPRFSAAQSEQIFNIPFRNIPLQTPTFTGFSFQSPGFATPGATAIPFQNIPFRGLYGPAEPGRRRDTRDSYVATPGAGFRFALRSREEVVPTNRAQSAAMPNVRLARRTPFGPVSSPPHQASRFARATPPPQTRTVMTRLQLTADRQPFARVRN